jgi:hypothetical protein
MRTRNTLQRLKEGVESWNKWRWENPDVQVDLCEASLDNGQLERANFEGAHLEGANLIRARLVSAHLHRAYLRGANLLGATIKDANLYEAHLEDAHLKEANLEGAVLSAANLERAVLTRANLRGATLMGAILEGAELFGADLTGADLTMAHLQRARLQWAYLDGANLLGAHLDGADFRMAKLHETDLSAADLRNTEITRLEYLYPLSLRRLRFKKLPYRRQIMRGRYQGIRGLDSCYGNRIFVRDAMDQDYLDTLESQLTSRWGRFWFWVWGLTDYGRSFMSVVLFASILMFGFGTAYSRWHLIALTFQSEHPIGFTPYYFSIVTYTTLGFGDVRPNGLAGEILVCAEVIFGYLTLGLLLAVLGNKIARRS